MSAAELPSRDSLVTGGVRWLAPLVVGVGLSAAYGPIVVEFFRNQWLRAYYQHFPFVLGAFAVLLWLRVSWQAAREEATHQTLRRGCALALLAMAWPLLAIGYRLDSPWLGYLSLVILISGLLACPWSGGRLQGWVGPWLLLWVIVPPPAGRDATLVAFLQRASSRASSFVLDAFGVAHLMDGNVLTLPAKQFFVDEACSGIISIMSIIACAAIYGVWRRRSAGHVCLLIVTGVLWATVMNTIRISAIAIAYSYWSIDWSEGLPHEMLSLAIFLVTFLALISTDVLLAGLLAPLAEPWENLHGEPLRFGRRLAWVWDRIFPAPQASETAADAAPRQWRHIPVLSGKLAACAALAFVAVPVWDSVSADPAPVAGLLVGERQDDGLRRALAIDRAFLPESLAGLRLRDFESVERTRDDALGNHSRSHRYVDERGTVYLISCDFAYEGGWHELTICYQGAGWTLDERDVSVPAENNAVPAWACMKADFSKSDGSRAYLVACAFDERGQPIAMPTQSLWDDFKGVFARNNRAAAGRLAFQVQAWVTSAEPIGEEQRRAVQELVLAARTQFRDIVAPPAQKAAAGGALDKSTTHAVTEK